MLTITVHHNDVEVALRLLQRQLQQSGLLGRHQATHRGRMHPE